MSGPDLPPRPFRAKARLAARKRVELEGGDSLETVDLGAGGAFLQGETVLEVGAKVQLTLELGEGEPPIQVEAEVRWADAAQKAMGVKFLDLTGEQEAKIEAAARADDLPIFDIWDEE